MKRLILLLLASAFTISESAAQYKGTDSTTVKIERGHFLPMKRRIDREIDKIKSVYRGEVLIGLTASYGTIKAEDTELMLIFDDINLKGTMTTVNPFVGYAYRDNHVVGVRFGYQFVNGELGNIGLNLGEQNDLSFSLDNMSLRSQSYAWSLFHRTYAGLDQKGRISFFAEWELQARTGTMDFSYISDNARKFSRSRSTGFRLNFNPGIAVYIFPNVCTTVSFGLGGLYYNKIRQSDELGEHTGSRSRSGLRFKFNLADINIGMVVHLWNKKKS
ncbi:MAG: hypothetical protein J6K38_07180 [Alistipes sp.]|nr:hypothetical protein [Alistipes sp.]MBP3456033.1 hypothetical protein [Alistipes sp.]